MPGSFGSLNRGGGLIAENCISVRDKSSRRAAVLTRTTERREKIQRSTPVDFNGFLIHARIEVLLLREKRLIQVLRNGVVSAGTESFKLAEASGTIPKCSLIFLQKLLKASIINVTEMLAIN